jgi:hypothetical protein
MFKIRINYCLLIVLFLYSCSHPKREPAHTEQKKKSIVQDSIVIDSNYSFDEAIKGTQAPIEIIRQLKLITVHYYSTDHRIHQGQVLTNIKIADRLELLFQFMLNDKFPVAHAIPVVKYDWDDDASMEANNTYSFCYRDISFSKHALGMAIDINPYFNPVRWKEGYENHEDKPEGAHFDPAVPGTFYKGNAVVREFKKSGFYWGHNFSKKHDDHHFEI